MNSDNKEQKSIDPEDEYYGEEEIKEPPKPKEIVH